MHHLKINFHRSWQFQGCVYSYIPIGDAWLTAFQAQCSGWIDPDDEANTGGPLSYIVSSAPVGKTTTAKAIYETRGTDLQRDVMLAEGLADFDYKVNVIFTVTDSDGASVTMSVQIQVCYMILCLCIILKRGFKLIVFEHL